MEWPDNSYFKGKPLNYFLLSVMVNSRSGFVCGVNVTTSLACAAVMRRLESREGRDIKYVIT